MDPQARIKSLSDQGNSVDVDPNIPIKRYFRSGMEMAKMAGVYEEEGNLESAFILYIRYITLFVEKIRNHPDYRNHSPIDKASINKRVKEIFPKAEKIKSCLKEKYQKDFKEFVAEQKILEENLRLEREERLRRERERERRELEASRTDPSRDQWNNIHVTPYHDASSPRDAGLEDLSYPTDCLGVESPQKGGSVVPSYDSVVSTPQPVPSRDLKPQPSPSVPTVDRGTKPMSLLSDQKGGQLRTILVPQQLLQKFLSLAYSNTSQNVETCGILAGKLAFNKFVITHLLVPQQEGTPDSCTTQHEEELFDQQDKFDLITLGWIHTHPTQTAFLSSVDLHTHCSYQLMMPEAIAIVCAPKFQETGYFTLTPSHGLFLISNCRQDGFHPHVSDGPLFQAAEHVQIDPSLDIQVVDLRR